MRTATLFQGNRMKLPTAITRAIARDYPPPLFLLPLRQPDCAKIIDIGVAWPRDQQIANGCEQAA